MKIRSSFVANSSSASCAVLKSAITELHRVQIFDHINEALRLLSIGINEDLGYVEENDKWCIDETDDYIFLFTSMDNFDMIKYLKLIGISEEHILTDVK